MIYEKIAEITSNKKMSIREVEQKAGVANGTIAKWKTASPTLKSLLAVSSVLDVKIEDLTRDEGGVQDAKNTTKS
mgnify:CR=1 FL=1